MIWAKDGWHRPKLITSGRDCTVIMVMLMMMVMTLTTVMLMVMTMVNVIKMVIMSGGKINTYLCKSTAFFGRCLIIVKIGDGGDDGVSGDGDDDGDSDGNDPSPLKSGLP